jgi:HlyD family secretion protein
MKRRIVMILILVIAAGLGGAWWWARTHSDQAVQILVSGGLAPARAQGFVDSLGGQTAPQQVQSLVASGSIEGEEVTVVSEFGGQIVNVAAQEGDQVEAGAVLIELDATLLQAQMAQAQASVGAAQANLENVQAGTHPAEILAAEAMLLQAQAQRDAAQRAWQDAKAIIANPQDIDAQIVQAKSAVDVVEASIGQAQADLADAQVQRDQYKGRGSMQEKSLYVVYDYQVTAAQAALDAAKANKAGAEQNLQALEALRRNPLALVSQVHAAEGQYQAAEAGVHVAETNLAELQAGPSSEELAVAQALVGQAQAAVSGLQAQIDKMTLRSPIAGIVTSESAHEGEAATAGATLLTVANLDEVKLTIYVPEDQLNLVYLGQQVDVQVDSFPGRVFTGTVSYISQQAEFTPKNVQTEKERVNMVFAVRIRLANPGHLLKPGMPADAYLQIR